MSDSASKVLLSKITSALYPEGSAHVPAALIRALGPVVSSSDPVTKMVVYSEETDTALVSTTAFKDRNIRCVTVSIGRKDHSSDLHTITSSKNIEDVSDHYLINYVAKNFLTKPVDVFGPITELTRRTVAVYYDNNPRLRYPVIITAVIEKDNTVRYTSVYACPRAYNEIAFKCTSKLTDENPSRRTSSQFVSALETMDAYADKKVVQARVPYILMKALVEAAEDTSMTAHFIGVDADGCTWTYKVGLPEPGVRRNQYYADCEFIVRQFVLGETRAVSVEYPNTVRDFKARVASVYDRTYLTQLLLDRLKNAHIDTVHCCITQALLGHLTGVLNNETNSAVDTVNRSITHLYRFNIQDGETSPTLSVSATLTTSRIVHGLTTRESLD